MALQDTSGPDRDPAGQQVRRATVLVVGAASRDLTRDDGRGWRLGGPATFAALTLARLGLDVRAVIGADAEAGAATELNLLHEAGVSLLIVPLAHGPVFVNEERPMGREQLAVDVAEPLDVAALPAEWRGSDGLLLAPVARELGPEWAVAGRPHRQDRPAPVVALGWQGLLRTLRAGEQVQRRPPGPSALLRMATLVGLSKADVDRATPLRSLEALLDPAATLAITDGERGGLLGEPVPPGAEPQRAPGTTGQPRRWRAFPAIPADRIVDPTGAGDVLLAALLATRLHPALGAHHAGKGGNLRLAAAAASLVVEEPGLLGVPTLEAVFRRAARPTRAASA